MMEPAYYPLRIYQGADLKVWFAIQMPSGVADPPTVGDGYTEGWLQVRDKPASDGGTVLLELTTDNGGIVLGLETDADGAQWSGYLYCSAWATAELPAWGEAQYDMFISNGSNVEPVLYGPATLNKRVSERP